ncbi:hypothetical protein EN829_014855 [Mesorhizobium sp. M00.F.Ca.ET.186.01.1.1]|nr:hypothetical protein EN848_14580 [bacterium M00.F.Ca.ET.205.01.1.1]TGU52963.1 hypothetical protein EN795_14815 [bacterium M00.F.Ca.ET.152.01.1.1]TGV35933.1 hypothetical protein EN829_014855 [Mesorhizobium sp. M00.F.Ca.ET.186.01.1.1]TGZ43515.1 hypothetical protein EN805_10425 [bacterium M00.F.Ca.ET.162.01.1.1]
MLTQAEVEKARKIFTERDSHQRIRNLVASKGIELMAGEGKEACVIVISTAYQQQIIADVTASLDQQIAAANAVLTAMGVEP